MKKIFFFLLLLPLISMAQRNFGHNDSLYKYIQFDTIKVCPARNKTITPVINGGWINIEWLNKIGAAVYPNIEDMYKWDYEWKRAMKGTSISY